jgi:hypothetical protein
VPITVVEVFVVLSIVPVDALGALAVATAGTTRAVRCAFDPVPVLPDELEPDEDGDELDEDELELEADGDDEPDEGELPPIAVVTVEEERAGQPSCSSEASCAFAVFTAASSAETVCWAARSVEWFVGIALALAVASATLSFATFVSSVATVCWSPMIVAAAVPLGSETV